MAKGYRYLEHTADGKFIATGRTLEEAFSNSAMAMLNLMCETSKIIRKTSKKIKVKAKNPESLLYNFLEEVIFLLDSKNFLACRIEKMKISGNEGKYVLEAEILGDNSKKYETFGEVKAVTYNSMLIKKEKGKFSAQVVVDL
ncbi:MAG: archease [archaeon]